MSDREADVKAKGLIFAGALLLGFFGLFGLESSSFFALVGNMGAGKSTLINAFARKKLCSAGAGGKSITQEIKSFNFICNEFEFNAIDTCGLDEKDEKENQKKINKLKGLLAQFPKIKKILLVKKYDDYRLHGSTIKNLLVYMECFPVKDFWKHVIIINTHSDTESRVFKHYMKNEFEPMCKKIREQKELMDYMTNHSIDIPNKIEEYFVESKGYLEFPDEYSEVGTELDKILKDIRSSNPMYDDVKVSGKKDKIVENTDNKEILKIITYRTITLYDKKEKYEIEEILYEEEKTSSAPIKTEYIEEIIEEKDIAWYDIITLGLARIIRDTKYIKQYKINTYKINGKEIKGEKLFVKKYWK